MRSKQGTLCSVRVSLRPGPMSQTLKAGSQAKRCLCLQLDNIIRNASCNKCLHCSYRLSQPADKPWLLCNSKFDGSEPYTTLPGRDHLMYASHLRHNGCLPQITSISPASFQTAETNDQTTHTAMLQWHSSAGADCVVHAG